jgi:hypothetical protein
MVAMKDRTPNENRRTLPLGGDDVPIMPEGSEAVNGLIVPATGCIRVQAKAPPAAQAHRLGKGGNARMRPEAPRPEG